MSESVVKLSERDHYGPVRDRKTCLELLDDLKEKIEGGEGDVGLVVCLVEGTRQSKHPGFHTYWAGESARDGPLCMMQIKALEHDTFRDYFRTGKE